MTYSEWIPVPGNRDTLIAEIVENKKFQIRTDKKIDSSNEIWWLLSGPGGLSLRFSGLYASKCQYYLQGTEPFLQNSGDFTFLKTSTKLQIWFEDVLQITWVYQDRDEANPCAMRKSLKGLKFRGVRTGELDRVSTHYRYQTGN